MTTTEIERLRTEAAAAGDMTQVAICDLAIEGNLDAVRECVERLSRLLDICEHVIRSAKAMDDGQPTPAELSTNDGETIRRHYPNMIELLPED